MKVDIKKGISITEDIKKLASNRRINKSAESEAQLLIYLQKLDFDYIKFIQVIMYLGSEESKLDVMEYSKKDLFLQYVNELNNKDWSDKGSEIMHITSKQILDEYLEKGLSIVRRINFEKKSEDRSMQKNETARGSVVMSNYYRLKTCRVDKLNEYLEKGWELIDIEKSVSSYGENQVESSITYHIGYPVACHISDLKNIIKKYEQLGLFEELKKRLCEVENIQPESIRVTTSSRSFWNRQVNSDTVDFLNMYKKVMSEEERFFVKVEKAEEKIVNKKPLNNSSVDISEDDLPF